MKVRNLELTLTIMLTEALVPIPPLILSEVVSSDSREFTNSHTYLHINFSLISLQLSPLSGFFIPGFPKLMRFQEHHDRILKKTMPKLKQHLVRRNWWQLGGMFHPAGLLAMCLLLLQDNQEVFTSLYTMKWFFQCFLDRVSTLKIYSC